MPFRVTKMLGSHNHCSCKSIYLNIGDKKNLSNGFRPIKTPLETKWSNTKQNARMHWDIVEMGVLWPFHYSLSSYHARSHRLSKLVKCLRRGILWLGQCFSADVSVILGGNWFPQNSVYLRCCIKWYQSWAMSTEAASPKINAIPFETTVHLFTHPSNTLGFLLCTRDCFRFCSTKQVRSSGNFYSSLTYSKNSFLCWILALDFLLGF